MGDNGRSEPCYAEKNADIEVVDAEGGMLFPSWCDSHTHLVYAGSREGEFVDKINGLTYEEIAKRGGGILNSADLLHETAEDELYRQSMERVAEIIKMGTGAVEIKSGYGLTLPDELKMLRVIARIRESSPITVRATFLGAHAVGRAYKGRQTEYVDHIIKDMIPAVAAEGLAEYIDVFCDEGFFTVDETARMLEAAAGHGIAPKIHANELAISGGVQVGVRHGALSVDHLERIGAEEIATLKNSRTRPTLLPGAAFFLGLPYPPARELIKAGLGVAIASDFNPGSSPSGSMKFITSLACIKMRMTPAEAINAATLNGACAMGLAATHGTITKGKRANFFITRPIPSIEYLPYSYSSPLIGKTFLGGREI
jgi:imidazolonepropionase